jgi:hypothetical protein
MEIIMKTLQGLLCSLLLLPCLAVGCASGDPGALAEDEPIGEASFAIQPNDQNRCCFPQVETAAACDARDGFFERVSGACHIFVEQECELRTAPSGEVGCCCKVKVLDTMPGCNNKDFEDFYPVCQ